MLSTFLPYGAKIKPPAPDVRAGMLAAIARDDASVSNLFVRSAAGKYVVAVKHPGDVAANFEAQGITAAHGASP